MGKLTARDHKHHRGKNTLPFVLAEELEEIRKEEIRKSEEYRQMVSQMADGQEKDPVGALARRYSERRRVPNSSISACRSPRNRRDPSRGPSSSISPNRSRGRNRSSDRSDVASRSPNSRLDRSDVTSRSPSPNRSRSRSPNRSRSLSPNRSLSRSSDCSDVEQAGLPQWPPEAEAALQQAQNRIMLLEDSLRQEQLRVAQLQERLKRIERPVRRIIPQELPQRK